MRWRSAASAGAQRNPRALTQAGDRVEKRALRFLLMRPLAAGLAPWASHPTLQQQNNATQEIAGGIARPRALEEAEDKSTHARGGPGRKRPNERQAMTLRRKRILLKNRDVFRPCEFAGAES